MNYKKLIKALHKLDNIIYPIVSIAAFWWIILVTNYCKINSREISNLKEKIEHIENREIEYKEPVIENHAEYLVTATVYHAVASQCDGDYLTTASGRKIKSTDEAYSHRYIAVSRDLGELFPYGCKVEVIGTGIYDGIYIVADTMNKRYTEYIDILINPDMPIGKWENVIIKKL